MRFIDWFNETVRHEPPRPMTREERCAEARELFLAKMRAHYGPDAERRIVRAIGRNDSERYGGPAVGDRRAADGQQPLAVVRRQHVGNGESGPRGLGSQRGGGPSLHTDSGEADGEI